MAVNHGGYSDSTVSASGNIINAALGYSSIPKYLMQKLESPDLIIHMTDGLYRGKVTSVKSYRLY